jgi:hypothetical protein
MKSNFILPALIVFSALVSSSQIKSKNTFLFKIKGSVQNYDKTKIYVHHRWDDIDFTDSANVVNNAFKFELNSAEPNMYWFTSTRDFNAQPNLIFFVDDNHVTVKLKGDSLKRFNFEGALSAYYEAQQIHPDDKYVIEMIRIMKIQIDKNKKKTEINN